MFTRSSKQKRGNVVNHSSTEPKVLQAFVPDYGDKGFCKFLEEVDSTKNVFNEDNDDAEVPRKLINVCVVYGNNKEQHFSSVEDISSAKKKWTPSTPAGSEKETQHQNLKTPEATDRTHMFALHH